MSDIPTPVGGAAGKKLQLTLGDKKVSGLLVGAIGLIVVALILLFAFNPFKWALPSVGSNTAPAVVTESVPPAVSSQTLADLKILSRQFTIKGAADLDRLYKEGKITADQYLIYTQLFENDKALAAEIVHVAKTQDDNNLVFGNAIKKVDDRVTAVQRNVDATARVVNDNAARQQNVNPANQAPVASTSSASSVPQNNSSVAVQQADPKVAAGTSTAVSTAGGIKNTLAVDLYVVLYGDWDGAKIVALKPGEVLKPGFDLGKGKSLQPGVHLNIFTLYNNGVTHSLSEIFTLVDAENKIFRPAKTELATYYWSNGLVPITGNVHYNKAFTILGSDNLFHDGYKVTERMGGHNVAVAVDTFDAGRIPTRLMRY